MSEFLETVQEKPVESALVVAGIVLAVDYFKGSTKKSRKSNEELQEAIKQFKEAHAAANPKAQQVAAK